MTESTEYKPIPLEQRKSQKLGWKEYGIAIGKPLLAPVITTLAGYLIGKQFKPPSFDKEPTGFISSFVQGYLTSLYDGQKDRSQAYAVMGFKVGMFITAYNLWRKHKVTGFALTDTVDKLEHVVPLQATTEKLREENTMLEKMVSHEQKKQEAVTHPEKASKQYRDLVSKDMNEVEKTSEARGNAR